MLRKEKTVEEKHRELQEEAARPKIMDPSVRADMERFDAK